MNLQISANSQAILLLTAPLMVGKAGAPAELLKQAEYTELTRTLLQNGFEPADLLSAEAGALKHISSLFESGRIARLLGRGFQLAQALDSWSARSIWVVSRADSKYPKRIKSRLRHDAPPVLYGCGDAALVDNGGLAVVGSRNADDEVLTYARVAGELAARAGHGLISGGAKGVDSAAMEGADSQGGVVCNVMAEGLAQAAISRRFRQGLQEDRTLLISPYDPSAGFNVGHAIARNKFIFALSDLGLVVNSDLEKGGTWAGAIEQLRKLRYVPLFIRSSGKRSEGLNALLEEGALPWPNPRDTQSLNAVFEEFKAPARTDAPAQEPRTPASSQLPSQAEETRASKVGSTEPQSQSHRDEAGDEPPAIASIHVFDAGELPSGSPVREAAELGPQLADEDSRQELFATFERLLKQVLLAPKKAAEIAAELDLNQAQTRDWLERLVARGIVEKKKGDATYRLAA